VRRQEAKEKGRMERGEREGKRGTDFRGGLVPCFEHPAVRSLAHLFEQIKDLERVHALHHRHIVAQAHLVHARVCVRARPAQREPDDNGVEPKTRR